MYQVFEGRVLFPQLQERQTAIEGVEHRPGGGQDDVAPADQRRPDVLVLLSRLFYLHQSDGDVLQGGGADGGELELGHPGQGLEGSEGGLSHHPGPRRPVDGAFGLPPVLLTTGGENHRDGHHILEVHVHGTQHRPVELHPGNDSRREGLIA